VGRFGPSFRCHLRNHSPFPDVFAGAENGFTGPEFCFVAIRTMKHAACQTDALTPQVVHLPT
jgi:hypothetical protein